MVIVWVRPEDTKTDIAAKIEERKAAFPGERLSVQVLRWLRDEEAATMKRDDDKQNCQRAP